MLSHVDQGQPTMVSIVEKAETLRSASARCFVKLPSKLSEYLRENDGNTGKGPVFTTAIIAGTMAVKKTHDLIPFCHPIAIESCKITIRHVEDTLVVECTVSARYKTGVEMEALVGVNLAALTIYDMCKAISHEIIIDDLHLIKKTGGKRDVVV